MDPLTPFTCWGWSAPYRTTLRRCTHAGLVVPVRSKSGLGTTRRGGGLHRIEAVAAFCVEGRIRYGARWWCRNYSKNAVLVNDPDPFDGICAYCEDAGPSVYRCFGATGRLLYIGSTSQHLRRLTTHKTQSPWWPEVASTSRTRYPSIVEARIAERRAIKAELPLYNIVDKPVSAA